MTSKIKRRESFTGHILNMQSDEKDEKLIWVFTWWYGTLDVIKLDCITDKMTLVCEITDLYSTIIGVGLTEN